MTPDLATDSRLIARHIATRGVTRLPPAEASAPDADADYEMTIRIRNGRIMAAMRRAGIKSQRELARLAGAGVQRLNGIINMRHPALLTNGAWAPAVLAISNVLGCTPDSLFTERQKTRVLATNKVVRPISEAEVDSILAARDGPSPEEVVFAEDRRRLIEAALSTIPPRNAEVIRRRFGLVPGTEPRTLDDVANEMQVTREGVRQIETKSLRLLKHPSRSDPLKDAL